MSTARIASAARSWGAAIAVLLVVAACEDTPQNVPTGPDAEVDCANGRAGPNVVNVTADHQEFVTSHEEIGSGWTTFRFKNRSHAPHFLVIEKMPVVDEDQKTVEDSKAEVVPDFQNILDVINDPTLNPNEVSFPDAVFDLPAWYFEVVFVGGPSLTSAGETSEAGVHLEPGTYVIECYVKTEDGTFHSTNGMIEGLVVNERGNAAGQPPRSDAKVTISSGDGITIDRAPRSPGKQTIEVAFEDQKIYSHGLGHDVHLVRLEPDADRAGLNGWMKPLVPDALAVPEPAGVDFLGGVQDMPEGSTAYVRANLKPGDYAWIAEVPDPMATDMLVTFSVP